MGLRCSSQLGSEVTNRTISLLAMAGSLWDAAGVGGGFGVDGNKVEKERV